MDNQLEAVQYVEHFNSMVVKSARISYKGVQSARAC